MGALRKIEAEPIASRVNRLSRELAGALDEWQKDLGGDTWVAHVSPASSSEYPIAYENLSNSAAPIVPGLSFEKLKVDHYWPIYDTLTSLADMLCGAVSQPRCDGDKDTLNPAGSYLENLLGLINWEKDKLMKQLDALPVPEVGEDLISAITLRLRYEVEGGTGNLARIAAFAEELARLRAQPGEEEAR